MGLVGVVPLYKPVMLELAGPNALYSFLLDGLNFRFQHSRFWDVGNF